MQYSVDQTARDEIDGFERELFKMDSVQSMMQSAYPRSPKLICTTAYENWTLAWRSESSMSPHLCRDAVIFSLVCDEIEVLCSHPNIDQATLWISDVYLTEKRNNAYRT